MIRTWLRTIWRRIAGEDETEDDSEVKEWGEGPATQAVTGGCILLADEIEDE